MDGDGGCWYVPTVRHRLRSVVVDNIYHLRTQRSLGFFFFFFFFGVVDLIYQIFGFFET